MDQYFAPILQRMKTTERYTNPQENMRLPYQIFSDSVMTDFT